jgi:6-phosphogluconolactonase (cycloisomerase 2 family)
VRQRVLTIGLALLGLAGPASGQELTYLSRVLGGVLNGVQSVVVSPDGAFVYTAAGPQSTIAIYSRVPASGGLFFVSSLADGVGGIDGLADVSSIALSPNGSRLYAASGFDDALVVFSRNAQTGALTPIQTLLDGVAGVDGLNSAEQIALSPDGTSLYVTARFDASVSAFDVDPVDGTLAFVRKRSQELGVWDVGTANGVAVSPDGGTVYVANVSANPNRLLLFDRNAGSSDIDYAGTTILDTDEQPLAGATWMTASPDGDDLYVAAEFDRAISGFAIGGGGALTPNGFVTDAAGGSTTSGPQGIVLNDAGTRLYTATASPAAVVAYDRDPSTGLLTFLQSASGEVSPGVTFGTGGELALSPDGAHLYVPDGSGQVLVFAVAAPEPGGTALAAVAASLVLALGRMRGPAAPSARE